ncbi:MAG: DUF4402 domain-containing protein [Elusimicrobium sp.]|nr:DUF4402 domain-containing protein [Elusimicrobium sp.]
MKKLMILLAMIVLSVTSQAATQTGQATVVIESVGITITAGTTMNFGTIISSTAADNMVLSTGGVVTGALGTGGSPAAGTFSITAADNTPLTISASNTTLTGPGAAMAVSTYTFNPTSGTSTNASGTMALNVGATLAVGANQTAGTYTGTYTLTVSY